MKMTLTSKAFLAQGEIPARFTCEGAETSPPLSWAGIPPGTRSLALIVEDPDAPDPAKPLRVWVHWLLAGIPPEGTGLAEGGPLPPSVCVGRNDGGTVAWQGPCPPIARHRYFFRLYALDTELRGLRPGFLRADLEAAIQGHVLAHAELMGTYEKRRRSR